MKKNKKAVSTKALSALLAVLLVLTIVINGAFLYFKNTIEGLFIKVEVSAEDTQKDALETSLNVEREGIVLLKNQNNSLPLPAEVRKVNLLGWASYAPVYNGDGSGGTESSAATSLQMALEAEGIAVNENLVNLHKMVKEKREPGTVQLTDFNLPEVDYTDADLEAAKEYSDVAIVCIERVAGEGKDVPLDMTQYENGETGRHYLELTQKEETLLKQAGENFSTVIVVLNTLNTMETGFLDQESVDAALWIGGPGTNGFTAVAEVLTGKTNPSGRLTDTYAYDLTDNPAFVNFTGTQYYSNQEKLYYVNFEEGIYVGYRWYETAAAQGYLDYAQTVQYPFGYGLSYSEFSQEWETEPVFDAEIGEYTFRVKVTNQSEDKSGKTTVAVYAEQPYTAGGIEKAKVVLAGFAKTGVIKAGESETVEVKIRKENLASYDYETEKAYVLDEGVYKFYTDLGNYGSHCWSAYDAGDVNVLYFEHELEKTVYREEQKRSDDSVAATNRLEEMTEGDGGITYLSRADFAGTYPQPADYAAEQASDHTLEDFELSMQYDSSQDANASYYENTPIETEKTYLYADFPEKYKIREELEGLADADETLAAALKAETVTIYDMRDVPYDDTEVWDRFVAQMSLDEMCELINFGGYSTAAVDSVYKKYKLDFDGPQGLAPYQGTGVADGICYPSASILASTWNVEQAKEEGVSLGQEFVNSGVSGWYGPAMNTHRTAFGGRNFEYYSEDGLLGGKIGSAVVDGAQEQGIYAYVKHFAFYPMESNTAAAGNVKATDGTASGSGMGMCMWINEQAAREIYLRAFEITVKEAKPLGMMAAFSRVGSVWNGASYQLNEEILRGEWGFEGSIVTDYYYTIGGAGNKWMPIEGGLLGGCDLWLSGLKQGDFITAEQAQNNNILQQGMKRAVKNIMYTTAQNIHVASVSYDHTWYWGWAAIDVALAGFMVIVVLCIKRAMAQTNASSSKEHRDSQENPEKRKRGATGETTGV